MLMVAASLAASIAVATPSAGEWSIDREKAESSRDALCRERLCRPPTTVRVVMKDGRVMETLLAEPSPIVLPNGWVTILPGEEVHVAFRVDGEALQDAHAVKRPREGETSISFHFTQDPKNGESDLVIASSSKRMVKLDLGMMLPDSDRVQKTSSCPVIAGGKSYEHWPHPVFQFVAARFRILPDGSSMACE